MIDDEIPNVFQLLDLKTTQNLKYTRFYVDDLMQLGV